jgi:outer membrane immunogenic protein
VQIQHSRLRSSLAAVAAVALFDSAIAIAAPPPPAQYNWTGFYLGASAGVRSSQTNWELVDFAGPPIDGASEQSFHDVGFRGGLYFGYNWQFAPRWVTGIEGDWGWGNKTTTQEGFLPGASGVFFPIFPGDTVSVQTTWDASLRARLGYLVTPSFLVYGTGGAAWQHYKLMSTCGQFICFPAAITATADVTRMGWTVGGGIEIALWRNWLARAEYRYADFGTARVTWNDFAPVFGVPVTSDIKLVTNTFQFGLAYRFDPVNRGAMPETMWPAPGQRAWNGIYVGLSGGARSSQTAWTTTDFAFFGPPIPGTNDESYNDTAFRGGLYAGYNWQFAPRWIAGVEGDFGGANKKTTQIGFLPGLSGGIPGGPINPGDSSSVKTTWDASLRARLGFLATPSLLVYGTGGIAWLHYEIASVCGTFTCIAEFTSASAKTAQGWTIGGGLEAAIMDGWRARAEYRYADFGTSQHALDVLGPVTVPALVDIKLQTHTVMFGLGYLFN